MKLNIAGRIALAFSRNQIVLSLFSAGFRAPISYRRTGIGSSLYIVGVKRATYNLLESVNLIVRQFVQATLIALCFGQFPTVLLTEPNEAVGDRIGQLDNTSHLAPRLIVTQQELQFRRQIALNCALNKIEEGFCHRRTINRTVEIRGIMLDVHLAIAVERPFNQRQ